MSIEIKSRHIELDWNFEWDISKIKGAFDEMFEYQMISEDVLNDLYHIFSQIEEKNLDTSKNTQLQKDFDKLKTKLKKDLNYELSRVKKWVFEILEAIPNIAKDETLKSMLRISDDFAETMKSQLSQEDTLYRNIHEEFFYTFIEIFKTCNINKLLEIQDTTSENHFKNLKVVHETMMDVVNIKVFLESTKLSEEKKLEIKNRISEKYPNVWKSNFSILKQLNKINTEYINYTKIKITEQVMEYLKINHPNYNVSWDVINDMIIFTSLIFRSGLSEYYEDFVEKYIDDLFHTISERKNSINKNNPKQEPKIIIPTPNPIKKKTCPNEINIFLNSLFEQLNLGKKAEKEIRSYILRIHLNGKSIRIKDMVYNFPVTKDIFTEDFIKQAKEIWIFFENWNWKKEQEPEPQPENKNTNPNVEENEFPMQVEDAVKVAFEKKVDWFLNNIKAFDWNWFVGLMNMAWYSIENNKYSVKMFDKLYKKDCNMKLSFLNDIKKNIYAQEKKSHTKQCYRKINLHNSYRILFLINNKTIDGIYSHTDYEKRIDGKVF